MRQSRRNIRHDRNQHVLLLIKPPRVKSMRRTKRRKLPSRHPFLPRLSQREREKLDDWSLKPNRWLADREELVDKAL